MRGQLQAPVAKASGLHQQTQPTGSLSAAQKEEYQATGCLFPVQGLPTSEAAAMLDRLADPSADLSEEDLQLLLAVLHAALGVLEGGSRKRKQQVVLEAAVLC